MKKSLQSLMTGLIDYAGLFPPAGLDMETAMNNFAAYKASAQQFMLGNFICPASRLEELYAFEELFKSKKPFYFSVICNAGTDFSAYPDSILSQLKAISSFTKKMGSTAIVNTLEIKLPSDLPDSDELIQKLNDGARLISAAVPDEVAVFYEPVLNDDWQLTTNTLAEAIALHNREFDAKTRYIRGGFKIRCGGVEAHMFPDVERVAGIIHACSTNNIPFKATAGLHHPLRHFNEGMQTKMHGFFNVFGAGILSQVHKLSAEQIKEILLDENADHFRFTDHFFSWQKNKAPISTIESARNTFCISFGSCSFDEPLDDLRSAGFLKHE